MCVNGPIVQEMIGITYGGVDWITLAQDTGEWWTVLNLITNLRVSQVSGFF